MRSARTVLLSALLLVAAFALASCGGTGGSGDGEMGGMDHGGSGGTTAAEETTSSGMDHGATMDTGSEEEARRLVAPNGEYSDAAFVDAMIPHHEGAIEMAEVALDNAEHREIETLAREIVDAQRAEIGELREIRGGLDPSGTTMQMSEGEMDGMMGMSEDPRELAQSRPFDKAFMDAMTPHHESAIAMANVALEESENPEIRGLAEEIVSAQEREILQMREWREEWYPKG